MTLDEIRKQYPDNEVSVAKNRKALKSLDVLEQEQEVLEAQMKEIGLFDAYEDRYRLYLQERTLHTGNGGMDLTNVYGQNDMDTEDNLRIFKMMAPSVPNGQKMEYARYLDYMQSVMNRRGVLNEKYFKDKLMSATILKSEPVEADAERRAKVLDQADDTGEALLTTSIAWYNSVLGGFKQLLAYGFGMNAEEDAYRDKTYLETLAQDMEEHNMDFAQMERFCHEMAVREHRPPERLMILQASGTEAYEKLMKHTDPSVHLPRLTRMETSFGVHNFDMTFDMIFTKDQKKAMKAEGKDIFDMIYVDGQSLNERYQDLYGQNLYYLKAEQMKCHLLSEVLNGAQVQVAEMVNGQMQIEDLTIRSDISGLDTLARRAPADTDEKLRASIVESQRRLDSRSQKEIDAVKKEMLADQNPYGEMEVIQPGPVSFTTVGEMIRGNTKKAQMVFSLYENLELIGNMSPEGEEAEKRENLVSDGFSIMDIVEKDLAVSSGYLSTTAIYQDIGVRDIRDLLYIDGESAMKFLKEKGFSNDALHDRQSIYAGLLAVITSGEHHVDLARIGMDDYGALEVTVSELRPDLRCLNKQEGLFERTRAHKAERLYRDDPSERQNRIREALSGTVMRAATRTIDQLRMEVKPKEEEKAPAKKQMGFNNLVEKEEKTSEKKTVHHDKAPSAAKETGKEAGKEAPAAKR